MDIKEICPIETWEAFEAELVEKFNFQGCVFTPEGIRITGQNNFTNTFCPAIKSNDKGQTFICSAAHMNMTAMAQKTGKPVVDACDAGLTKVVVPIFADDEFIGVAGGCGLLTDDEAVDTFAASKLSGLDESLLEDLAGTVPRASKQTVAEFTDYIQNRIAQILSQCGFPPH